MPLLSPESLGSALGAVALALGGTALRLALVGLVAYVVLRSLRTALHRLEALLIRTGQAGETYPGATAKRVTTMVGVVRTLASLAIWSLAAIVGLAQLGFDLTPVLAGAGIVGLAVGFGAQNLVKDLISGFFLVFENHVGVGDVAVVNGTGGLVETITFRTIILRDLAGAVHVFPHGSVTTLANMTKGWSAYVLDVGIAYREDTDRVVAVMTRVADELRQDPAFAAAVLEPLDVFGVDRFAESEVTIKARLRTRPGEQWRAGREYRRRLKKALEAAGIETPVPQRALSLGGAAPALPVVLRNA